MLQHLFIVVVFANYILEDFLHNIASNN